MKRLLAIPLFVAFSVASIPAADVINLPPVPPPVVPPLPPAPGASIKLVGKAVYDFTTTAPCIVRAYPASLVTITKAEIPANETFRDRQPFFDGSTQRVYKGPCTLYNVTAAGVGKCDLVITPVGFKLEFEIKTVPLEVDSGQGPIPPPIPPGPTPQPDPLTSFRVIFVYESADLLAPEQRAVIFGKAVEDWLLTNCTGGKAGWRRRDKDAPGDADPTMAALWNAVKPARLPNGQLDPNRITTVPCVVMERNSKVMIVNLEGTPAKMVEVLSTYRGK